MGFVLIHLLFERMEKLEAIIDSFFEYWEFHQNRLLGRIILIVKRSVRNTFLKITSKNIGLKRI